MRILIVGAASVGLTVAAHISTIGVHITTLAPTDKQVPSVPTPLLRPYIVTKYARRPNLQRNRRERRQALK